MKLKSCIHVDYAEFFKAAGIEDYHSILEEMMESYNVGNDSVVPLRIISEEEKEEWYEPWEVEISNALKRLNLGDNVFMEICW